MSNDQLWALFEQMQGEIAREIRVMLGEEAYDQRIFTAEERARRVEALKKCAFSEQLDEERHESWCQMHRDSGWTYGPEFRPDLKQHNNLLPWNELPASTRSKANIFAIVARYARALEES
jgi:hypothetical protein